MVGTAPRQCCGLIISLYADGPCLYLSGIIVCPLRARIKEVMMMKKGRFVSVVLNKITYKPFQIPRLKIEGYIRFMTYCASVVGLFVCDLGKISSAQLDLNF